MARMECKCGQVLSTSAAPNEVQYRVYSDWEWDRILSVDSIEAWKFPMPEYDVWRCTNCERVYVFAGGYGKAIKVYRLEEDENEEGA